MKKQGTALWLPAFAFLLLFGVGLLGFSVKGNADVQRTVPKTVMYVEVNDNEFNNIGKYTLEGSNKPAIDIGIIFAANINYNTETKKPYLYLNEQVERTLNDKEEQIQPLQARGTKVLLSILGNHQGAGFANFESYESADAFAAELAQVVEKYGLDGIDFDDEYAEYGKNETPMPNDQSFIWLLQALRGRLGDDKLITLYNIGPAAENSRFDDRVSKNVDYAWNPYYGTWSAPEFPGMDTTRLSAAAVEVDQNKAQSVQFAKRTLEENYGIFLMYNLKASNSADFLSGITQALYGQKTIYTPSIPSVR